MFIDNLMCYMLGFGCGILAMILFKDLLLASRQTKYNQRVYNEGYTAGINGWDKKNFNN